MLRIWDSFLLEGPKVLFRFALALLAFHEGAIMERTDTISVMKVIKAAAKLTYDTDGLIKVSYFIIMMKGASRRTVIVNIFLLVV